MIKINEIDLPKEVLATVINCESCGCKGNDIKTIRIIPSMRKQNKNIRVGGSSIVIHMCKDCRQETILALERYTESVIPQYIKQSIEEYNALLKRISTLRQEVETWYDNQFSDQSILDIYEENAETYSCIDLPKLQENLSLLHNREKN